MSQVRRNSKSRLFTGLLLIGLTALPGAPADQKKDDESAQLPPELRKAKVYRLPEEETPGETFENPVIYKNLSYQNINLERLVLHLFLSVKPVDRAATIRKIYFQDIRVNGIPVEVETFDKEFKLSKKDVVDLPAPLQCSIVFSDLPSLKPVKEIVEKDSILVTGKSFIEVKLNPIEKIALRTKQLVIPVEVREEVPLQMFSGNPFLQAAAVKILDTLSDPSTAAGIALAKEHLAKVTQTNSLEAIGQPSVLLLYCEYTLRDPKTQTAEKFSQSGTGFVISPDGRAVTTKRVVEPWKFDPQIAFLMERHHLELDPKGYKLSAWPVGSQVTRPDGQPDFQTALSTEKETLKILKTAPDQMEKQDYQDPDSGDRASLNLHARGGNDVAVIQLVGDKFQPLGTADPATKLGPDVKTALFGFPFGLSQAQASPQLIYVNAKGDGSLIALDRPLNAGESGAPLLTPEGKVLAFAGGTNECIPIEAARKFLQ